MPLLSLVYLGRFEKVVKFVYTVETHRTNNLYQKDRRTDTIKYQQKRKRVPGESK